MATSTSPSKGSAARTDHRMPNMLHGFTRATRPIRIVAKAAVFFLKVFPMLPSRPLDWVTPRPVVERLRYKTSHGETRIRSLPTVQRRPAPRCCGLLGRGAIRGRSPTSTPLG